MIRALLLLAALLLALPADAASPVDNLPSLGTGGSVYPLPDPAIPGNESNLWITQSGTDYRIDPLRLGYIFVGPVAPLTPYLYQLWWNNGVDPEALMYYDGANWIALFQADGIGVISVGLGVPANSIFGVTGSPVVSAGTLGLTTTGNSGGLLYFSDSSTVSSSPTLTANTFLTGGGAGQPPNALALSGIVFGNGAAAPTAATVNGLVFGNGAAAPTAYSGTSCTNQFIRSLDGSGVATCATVAATDLADIVAPDTNLKITYNAKGLVTAGTTAACSDLSDDGTACVANTGTSGHNLPFLDGTNTWSGTQTFASVFGTVNTIADPTYTLQSSDCGKILRFTNAADITLTLPDSIIAGCSAALVQIGAGQIIPTTSGGATLNNARGYTKSYGQWAMLGLTVDANSGGSAAHYVMTGDGTQ